MGVGEAVFYASPIFAAVAVLVVAGALRISSRRDPVAEHLAEAEATYRTELHAAPVIGVPYDTVRSDGSHDLYPHMSQHSRDAVVASLNEWLAWPARERAS